MAEIIRLNPDDEQAALFSVEAEQQVIGSLLLDNSRVGKVVLRGGAASSPMLFHVSALPAFSGLVYWLSAAIADLLTGSVVFRGACVSSTRAPLQSIPPIHTTVDRRR